MRCYSELIELPTFIDRYRYLKLDGIIGEETFGWDRYVNQEFYHSKDWRNFRNDVIVRDCGLDLAMDGYEIGGRIIIHHIEPITYKDIINKRLDKILDFENVVCVSHNTHEAIHYGDESLLFTGFVERTPGDTCPWKRG